MARPPIDTNVLVRFLVGTPESVEDKFRGVFPFFERLERGEAEVHLPDLVLFQTCFVLTSFYKVPRAEAAEKLQSLLSFRGIRMEKKAVARNCLGHLRTSALDLVDAYLLAWAREHGADGVYSFDTDIERHGIRRLPVE